MLSTPGGVSVSQVFCISVGAAMCFCFRHGLLVLCADGGCRRGLAGGKQRAQPWDGQWLLGVPWGGGTGTQFRGQPLIWGCAAWGCPGRRLSHGSRWLPAEETQAFGGAGGSELGRELWLHCSREGSFLVDALGWGTWVVLAPGDTGGLEALGTLVGDRCSALWGTWVVLTPGDTGGLEALGTVVGDRCSALRGTWVVLTPGDMGNLGAQGREVRN